MNKLISFSWRYSVLLLALIVSVSCEPDDPCEQDPTLCDPEDEIVGQEGNPQFNLQFTNPEGVDLDLYVEAPNGEIVFYGNPYSNSGGELDVDCLCGICPNGPNENIFWPINGSAPRGTYKYWVDYFGACNQTGATSSFTLRVLENGRVQETRTGTLSSGRSQVYSYTF